MADRDRGYSPMARFIKLSYLDVWLDILPVLAPPYSQSRTPITCAGCNFPLNLPSSAQALQVGNGLIVDQILRLPCGCKYRRGCIEAIIGPGFSDKDDCPTCGFVFFAEDPEPFRVRAWVARLESIEISTMKEDDRHCGICRRDYDKVSKSTFLDAVTMEQTQEVCTNPKKTPCRHIFGQECLAMWLETATADGNPRSCPTCRHELFGASLSETLSVEEEIREYWDQQQTRDVQQPSNGRAAGSEQHEILQLAGLQLGSPDDGEDENADLNLAETEEREVYDEEEEEEEKRYRSELQRYAAGNDEPERFWRGIGGAR